MNQPLQEDVDFLEHFGIKGQKWGVRKDRAPGVSRKIDTEANKDAREFARAKMFFGDGAGTRRKLIKKSVEAKSSRDPEYKKAFDHHLDKQKLDEHATGARKEREKTDNRLKRKQRTGFIARKLTGEMGTQAAFTAAAVGGVAYLNSNKGRQHMKKAASAAKNFKNSQQAKKTTKFFTDFFAKQV